MGLKNFGYATNYTGFTVVYKVVRDKNKCYKFCSASLTQQTD